jgi:hypothetical protein
MECLGLHNKPTAEVHPGHKLTGPKEKEEVEEEEEEEHTGTIIHNHTHIYSFFNLCIEFHVAPMQTKFCQASRTIWEAEQACVKTNAN